MVVPIIAMGTYSFGQTISKSFRSLMMASFSALALGIGLSPFLVIPGAGLFSLILLKDQKISTSTLAQEDRKGELRRIIFLLSAILFGMAVLYWMDLDYFLLSALMMKIDLFAFGGGFTSVPLMLHELVKIRGWIDERTFMDGIALGQVTPGPIVITATFVGYLLYGFGGSLVATISIFTPSFILLTITNPFFDRLKASPIFLKATQGILASFVGLLFYVLIKFTLAVHWDTIKVLLGVAVLLALIKKVDLLYVIFIGALISLWIFR